MSKANQPKERYLGLAAKKLRLQFNMTQAELAQELGISIVHLSNIENDHSMPSPELVARYRHLTGIDLHVLDWCDNGDLRSLPKNVREAALKLREAFGTMKNDQFKW